MRAVFINLDRAVERRAFMESQGARLGLALSRLPAVEASAISDATVEAIGRAWERPLTRPELACFLSHRALWEEVAAGDAPMLLLEDDVVLSRRLPLVLARLAALEGIDVLNLESFDRRRFVGRKARAIGEGVSILRLHRDKAGLAAYILWPAGARQLLAHATRGAAPADAFLHGLKSLRSHVCEPALAIQVHLLAARGVEVPIAPSTFIQATRSRLPLTAETLPFHLRRAATQVRLAGEHSMRLFGRRYRRVSFDDDDFRAEDHSRS